jgi:hypothetical protein
MTFMELDPHGIAVKSAFPEVRRADFTGKSRMRELFFPSPCERSEWWGGVRSGGQLEKATERAEQNNLAPSPHPGSHRSRDANRPSPPLRGGRERREEEKKKRRKEEEKKKI